jgi:large subunit ribosomal protein L1
MVKKYTEVEKSIEPNKTYELAEAVATAKKTAFAKFDESVELHLRMGVDIP